MSYIIAFLIMASLDAIWARYIAAISGKPALKGAVWSAAIVAMGGIATVQYTQNSVLLIPAAIGAFVGTYLSVWYDKRQETKKWG